MLSQGVDCLGKRTAVEPLKRGDAVAVGLMEALVAEELAGRHVDHTKTILAATLRAGMVLAVEDVSGDTAKRR